jgi:hypothetical protein
MEVLYRAGYLIRVLSWENDGDNYNTKEIQVDTEQEARDVVEFCNMFDSSSRNQHDIGNLCDGEAEIARPAFRAFYENHPDFINLTPSDYEGEQEETDAICDAMMDIAYDLGLSGGDYFYTRVCERVQVYRIPTDVLIEQIQFK